MLSTDSSDMLGSHYHRAMLPATEDGSLWCAKIGYVLEYFCDLMKSYTGHEINAKLLTQFVLTELYSFLPNFFWLIAFISEQDFMCFVE